MTCSHQPGLPGNNKDGRLPCPSNYSHTKIFRVFLLLLLDLVRNVSLYLSVADLNVRVELESTARLQVQLINAPVFKVSSHHHRTG